jgi:di/tricarboxylate transporter
MAKNLFVLLKASASGWWKIFNDLLVPAIYAVAGAYIYSELDNAIKSSPESISEMLGIMGERIMTSPILLIIFMVLLFLWLLSKFRKDPTQKELEKLNKKLDILIQRGNQNEESKSEKPKL